MAESYEVGDRVLVDDHLLGIITEASRDGLDGLPYALVRFDMGSGECFVGHINLRWIPPDDWKKKQDE